MYANGSTPLQVPFLDSCCKSEILGDRAYCFKKVGRKLKAHMNGSKLYLRLFKTKSQLGTLKAEVIHEHHINTENECQFS